MGRNLSYLRHMRENHFGLGIIVFLPINFFKCVLHDFGTNVSNRTQNIYNWLFWLIFQSFNDF